MSNTNSFSDVIYQQNNGQPIVLSVPKQGHTQFMLGASPAILTVPNPMALIPSSVAFPGRAAQTLPLVIKAAGTFSLGRGVSYQLDINQGTGLTPAIASSGLQITPLGAGLYLDNWFIQITAMWDSASLNLRGYVEGWVGNISISQATLVNSAPATLAALQFNIAATVTSANPSNSFTLNEFSGDLI